MKRSKIENDKGGRLSLDAIERPSSELFKFTVKIPEVTLGTEVKIDVPQFVGEKPKIQFDAFKRHFEQLNSSSKFDFEEDSCSDEEFFEEG